jgi:hypothetical protein
VTVRERHRSLREGRASLSGPETVQSKKDMAKEYIEERQGNYYVAGTRISLMLIVHGFRRG